ncbi:MAG: hypothetical protein KF709_02730 [Gemmatimonadaceae bacterium]|nr:hypothetical protein [Gemmatimonadaceae bacterium]
MSARLTPWRMFTAYLALWMLKARILDVVLFVAGLWDERHQWYWVWHELREAFARPWRWARAMASTIRAEQLTKREASNA